MVRCPECGKSLRARKGQTYRYLESGLGNVTLTGIRVFHCAKCGLDFPEIPNIRGLHRSVASLLARKPAPLTGAEFRFLRKEIELKATDLARDLGITNVTISRWETGARPINPVADRLLRLLYSLHTVQKRRAVEPAKFVKSFLETMQRIVPSDQPAESLPIRVPVSTSSELQEILT